ncbi:hypothetical protein B0H14DRAFT_3906685 [Mycena olivaceomarginata]|nr:hypothetical protein B0H14DRAFT_3906685 [Mycena olivaceomarginata]
MAVEVPAAGLSLGGSHPLSEELSSLRALVARFQLVPPRTGISGGRGHVSSLALVSGCSSVVGGARRLYRLIPHFLTAACACPQSGRRCCKRDRAQVARGGALQSGLGLRRMHIVEKAGTRDGDALYLLLYELGLTKIIAEQSPHRIDKPPAARARHLDTSAYTARIAQLEAENKLLRAELGVLRDNPASPPSSSLQSGAPSSRERETVAELTLTLRALSAKHTLALASLSTATQSLTEAPCGRARRSTPQTKHTRSFPVFHPPWLTRVRAILFTDHLITFRHRNQPPLETPKIPQRVRVLHQRLLRIL